MIIVAVSLAVVTILMFVLSLQSQGYRVLRFTTLVPVVIAFSLILRGTAPLISYMQSERSVEAALSQTEIGRIPDIAVCDVPPGVEYGLAFYRNHPVANYERSEIPAGDHIVVAAEGSQKNWNTASRPPRDSVRRIPLAAPDLLPDRRDDPPRSNIPDVQFRKKQCEFCAWPLDVWSCVIENWATRVTSSVAELRYCVFPAVVFIVRKPSS